MNSKKLKEKKTKRRNDRMLYTMDVNVAIPGAVARHIHRNEDE